jgi:hypothetical protein
MTKILYIPEGRYIKWNSKGKYEDTSDIYEESNFYNSDAYYGKMPVKEYLANFIYAKWELQRGTKHCNNFDNKIDYCINEFEIIYDES